MALREQDFEMWAGDHKRLKFTIEDKSTVEGFGIKWAMSRSVRGEKIIDKEGTADGNIAIIDLDSEDTEGLKGRFYHELELTDAEDKISTVAIGRVQIWPTLITGTGE